ncbi:MAG: flagellar export chaperone FlgN [Anaerohalosphaera sp.]|nr:flagellar export chaperone FlgN [Anaerohalosphaera sp.]
MISTVQINEKVDRLINALTADKQHLQQGLIRLTELRDYLIKNDPSSMEQMLKTIRSESDAHLANEYTRQTLRRELAGVFGIEFSELTLVRIAEFVTNPRKHQLLEKRRELKGLAADLKVQYQATAMLIKESARLNKLLLNSLMDSGSDSNVTYNANGYTSRETGNAFMSFHL